MRADDFDIPAGQPFRKVRDFLLRNTHPRLFGRADVTEYFGADITAELLAKGLIERNAEGKFQVSLVGTRLASKLLIPPIPRAKAEKFVADMLARARIINDSPELLCRISKITAFGSFVTDAAELNDIDVAVEIQRKHVDGVRWIDAAIARAEASGRRLHYSQKLDHPEREVMLLLKNRNRYIQFCSPIMLEDFDTPKRVIFSDETNH
jgi:hypothetical protein